MDEAEATWEEFLTWSELDQISYIETTSRAKIKEWTAKYEAELERVQNEEMEPNEKHPDWKMRVWAAMLEQGNPNEYLFLDPNIDEHRDIENNLTSRGKAAIKADTVEARVRPLLKAPLKWQKAIIRAMTPAERKRRIDDVDKFARQWGRSEKVRNLEELLKGTQEP